MERVRVPPKAVRDMATVPSRAPTRVSHKAGVKKSTIEKQERAGRKLRKAGGTSDSFVNFALNLGIGTNNALSASSYGFNPITRIRTLLDWIHRGSWIGGMAVDLVADDMTRAGIEILSASKPEDEQKLQQSMVRMQIWTGLNETIKWARLYGGCIAVLLIDGQNPTTPLRIEAVGKDKFKGLMVLDRWMVEADQQHLISELGPMVGKPEYYRVVSDAPAFRGQRIHYSRCIRVEGIKLPIWQRMMENGWGLSVLERLYDRMIAFDSATTGAAQLVYKSFLRTYAIDGLREAATAGGQSLVGISKLVEMMRKWQGIEGITLLDSKDKFEAHSQTGFTGIADVLIHFAQQISGSLQIPMVRLFGQSPVGLNSTGESDLRTYYDGILQAQERDLREGVNTILRVTAQSEGIKLKPEFGFNFVPLWQLTEAEKSEISDRDTKSVIELEAAALISERTALKELKGRSKVTGRYTNITEEDIDKASEVIEPPMPETGAPGAEGEEGPDGVPAEANNINVKKLQEVKKIEKAAGKESGGGGAGDRAFDQGLPYSEIGGIQVVIEQFRGSIRRGEDWETILPADYGYIRRVGSAEGSTEWLDCFVGPLHSSRDVWIIDALDPETGSFDEHKVMLAFGNSHQALDCFKAAYDDTGAQRVGAVTHMSMDSLKFKNWLANGDKTQPYQQRSAA